MKIRLMAGLLLLTALPVLAMPPADANRDERMEQRQKQHTEMMTKTLNLSAEQTTQFELIMQGQREAHQTLGDRSREQRRALHEETKEKLSAILDKNQLGQFEAFTQGMRMARHQQRGRGGMQQRAPITPEE